MIRWYWILWVGFLGIPILVLFIFLTSVLTFYSSIVESFEHALQERQNNTVLLDRHGQPFTTINGSEKRLIVPLQSIHPSFAFSVMAIEDKRFYQHRGVDLIRIFGAIFHKIVHGGSFQGASTLTQQLVKLTMLSPERTIERKLKEAFISMVLEMHWSKNQILEHYLNTIYLGYGNYGVEQAALAYFGKSSSQLRYAESAFLAGLIKKPEGFLKLPPSLRSDPPNYFPEEYLQTISQRQKIVLRRLYELGRLTQSQYQTELQHTLQVKIPQPSELHAPYFSQQILSLLRHYYRLPEVTSGGYKIYTTLDTELQEIAEKRVEQTFQEQTEFEQIAFVSIEPHTGSVRALIGGKNYRQSQFNRATQAKRQPGSVFKPLIYAAALEDGHQIHSTMLDEKLVFEWTDNEGEKQTYEPRNFDRLYGAERTQYNEDSQMYHEDEMTLAHALARSINTIAVKLLHQTGLRHVHRLANRLEMEIPSDVGLCLALGCAEVPLLNLTASYSTFVNQGNFVPPVFITRIVDHLGQKIYQHTPVAPIPIFSKETAFQMSQILHHVIQYGTGKNANWPGNDRFIGGKTGTTTDLKDAWFIGFSPELVSGVWIGNDDNLPMQTETGANTPAKFWAYFMEQATTLIPRKKLMTPAFHSFPICIVSGGIATTSCPQVVYYAYPQGQQPQSTCWYHPGRTIEPYSSNNPFAKQLANRFSSKNVE